MPTPTTPQIESPVSVQIYRVTVRGFFEDLDPGVRATLLAEVDDHQPLDAAFTESGTLVYDRSLAAFSFRYQLRVDHDEDDDREIADLLAEELGLDRAKATLAAAGIGAKGLRVTASNMGDVWERRGAGRPS